MQCWDEGRCKAMMLRAVDDEDDASSSFFFLDEGATVGRRGI